MADWPPRDCEYVSRIESVACYYFHFPKPNSKQVVVKELSVDKNGFEIESIDFAVKSVILFSAVFGWWNPPPCSLIVLVVKTRGVPTDMYINFG